MASAMVVPPMAPAVKGSSAEVPAARAAHHLIGTDPRLKGGHGGHRLEGGARRVGAAQRLIQQGSPLVIGQGLIIDRSKAAHELVGVEARGRGHAQDVPRAAIDHHRGPALFAENLQGAVLDVSIKGELDLFAGRRRNIAGDVLAHLAAIGVHLHLLGAGLAPQVQVESLLHPLAADAEPRMQQYGVGVGAFRGDVFLIDLGHIADDVGECAAVRVDPHLTHVRRDT
jgi:hypothetical protein